MREAPSPIRPQQHIDGFGDGDQSAGSGERYVEKLSEAKAMAEEETNGEEGKEDREAAQSGSRRDTECQEVQVPKVAADPGQPTAREKALHDLLHMPFRTWCYDCLQGQGKDRYHLRIQDEDGCPG